MKLALFRNNYLKHEYARKHGPHDPPVKTKHIHAERIHWSLSKVSNVPGSGSLQLGHEECSWANQAQSEVPLKIKDAAIQILHFLL